MIYLVNGNQEVLILEKIKEILAKNLEEVNEFTTTYFDAEETSIQDIVEDVLTLPFGYEKKAVVIKKPFFLCSAKEPKLAFQNEYQILEYFLENNDDNSIMIIYHIGKLDERKVLTKKIRAVATNYEVEDIGKNNWLHVAKRLFAEHHVQINDRDIEFFLTRVGTDLGFMMREIEKLALYSKKVTREDIEKLISRPLEENSYLIIDALINHDLQTILSVYNDLRIQNEEPIRIITTLANQLHLQYQVNALMGQGNSEKGIADILAIHPYRVKLMMGKSRKIDQDEIKYLLSELSLLDIEIKTGNADRYQTLELFFIKNT